MLFALSACGNTAQRNETQGGSESTDEMSIQSSNNNTVDPSVTDSNITSVDGVPLITLNNGVEMPQFGLGTQIQSLENGDLGILNQTSREAVAAALRSGYRHLDTAHGYMNERGVGQGIKTAAFHVRKSGSPVSYGQVNLRMLTMLLIGCSNALI